MNAASGYGTDCVLTDNSTQSVRLTVSEAFRQLLSLNRKRSVPSSVIALTSFTVSEPANVPSTVIA
ncbi:protein of unknown function [Shewanella benthica]|uniref:Uncharacterized protein n=1 Tax=Shewanella benthica TaxID=43661 RepID=A0A330M5U2_9GAMM|nr:protein of unknown function [Shewanella benthica]